MSFKNNNLSQQQTVKLTYFKLLGSIAVTVCLKTLPQLNQFLN